MNVYKFEIDNLKYKTNTTRKISLLLQNNLSNKAFIFFTKIALTTGREIRKDGVTWM